MNWIQSIVNSFKKGDNKFYNNSFFQLGITGVPFDFTSTWAVETALLRNADVFAVVSQMAKKCASVPYYIKKVDNEKSLRKFNANRNKVNLLHLKSLNDAFNDDYLPIPLENPNPLYDWQHFFQLYTMYLTTTGNVFIYKHYNELDELVGLYLLPSYLMKIYVKEKNTYLENESPILGYDLIYNSGASVPFHASEVEHIKLPNPEWGLNGEHLYGLSPLKPAYYNVENQIQATKHLYKMFKSSGAFGFIFAKGEALKEAQARQFTERIKEMDESKERLARISGIAKEIGFTRIALGNADLQPWKSLDFDRKTICNVLGWRDELLNNDGKSRLGGDESNEARKAVLMDTVLPLLQMLEKSLERCFDKFKGYDNTKFIFDITDMPEVQDDIAKLVEWASKAPITTNEFRELLKYEAIDEDIANKILIRQGYMTLDELEARGLQLPNLEDFENNNA